MELPCEWRFLPKPPDLKRLPALFTSETHASFVEALSQLQHEREILPTRPHTKTPVFTDSGTEADHKINALDEKLTLLIHHLCFTQPPRHAIEVCHEGIAVTEECTTNNLSHVAFHAVLPGARHFFATGAVAHAQDVPPGAAKTNVSDLAAQSSAAKRIGIHFTPDQTAELRRWSRFVLQSSRMTAR